MSKQPINLRLDPELLAATDALAAAMNINRTDLIERGLRRELLHDGQREFIYVLLDETRTVRYVGRSREPSVRLREHLATARIGGGSPKERWLAELIDAGHRPTLVIIDDAEPGQAIVEAEAYWIDHFRRSAKLMNGTPGGVDPHTRQHEDTQRLSLRIDADLKHQVDHEADQRGQSIRVFVERALQAALSPPYPRRDGPTIVLGPEIFASQDGQVICWRGENYVPQPTAGVTTGPDRSTVQRGSPSPSLTHFNPQPKGKP